MRRETAVRQKHTFRLLALHVLQLGDFKVLNAHLLLTLLQVVLLAHRVNESTFVLIALVLSGELSDHRGLFLDDLV